jgi:multiple antibiotic resistance protein
MNNLSFVFIIFFLTLGPLKVIPIFYRLTYNASLSFRKRLAFRATILSSTIIFIIAILGRFILGQWDVSRPALLIAGGLLFLIAAIQMLLQFKLPQPLPQDAPPPTEENIIPLAINPLTIPTIITPYGVVAILVTTSQAQDNPQRQLIIFAMLFLIIILNWLGMILAKVIIEKINIVTLLIIGWVFAVLQTGLAIDLMIEGFRTIK